MEIVNSSRYPWLLGLSSYLLLSTAYIDAADISPKFSVGQEWSIKSSPPTTAKVVIDRIEPWRDKIAIHVSIIDIPSSGYDRIRVTRIDHIPFERSALAASVDELLATGVVPPLNFEAGYNQWKEANGGIFTIPVAQAIHIDHKATNMRSSDKGT
jgi:hypothetical protein